MKKSFNADNRENSKKTLLIVDDNEFVTQELCEILSDEYGIITADNGKCAADLLQSRCADISLVLFSGSINKADEYTVMAAVRHCSKLKNIPAIMLLPENFTAANNVYKLGIADCISVPINADAVRRRVKNTLLLYSKTSLFDTTDAILQQEQLTREYYITLSNDTLFEYNKKRDLLTVGRVGAQRLCIHNMIHNPKESKEILAFGKDTMQKLFSQIRAVSSEMPNIIYDCSLTVNGEQCPYTILIRVLWDKDDKCYSRLFGKLINAGAKPTDGKLNVQTHRDLITGLYTRKAARRIIEKRLLQRKNESYLMILLDIDKQKNINDYYGHGVGDKVLGDFAHKCESLLGTDGVAARVGGDEFMLFMRCEKNAADEAYRIYDELCTAVRIYAATASFGISLCSDDGVMYDELYHKADVALRFAKQSHTPICFYRADLPDFPHIHTPIDSQNERTVSSDAVLLA